jgi:signal transduction histidine kinase
MSKESLEHTLEVYRMLVEIARDLASTLELGTLLQRIVKVASELCDAEASSILLYDQKRKELTFQASTDIENTDQMRGIVVPKESIAGWVAMERKPVIVADVHQDNRFFKDVEKKLDFPTRSILAVPMIVKDKLVGVLEALNRKRGVFSEEDQAVLQVLAGQAAVAIENTRLFHQSDAISELVHELRTPLTSIHTVAYLLQQPTLDDKRRIEFAQNVQREVHRLTEMTNNFLDLSRLESGRAEFQLSRFSLATLVEQCCEGMRPRAEEKKLFLQVSCQADLKDIEADRGQIQQVILNLLSNAIKYNRPEGTISVHLSEQNNEFVLAIQDTGIGIPKDALEHMFEKFYRVPGIESGESGTGLGLSICKRIIDNHGGKIGVESRPGEGTRVYFALPQKQKKG